MTIQHEAILGRSNLYNVDPRQIQVVDGWNPRINFSEEDDLIGSIIENGVKKPLTVKKVDEKILLIDGERRLRAVLKAISEGNEIQSVPCLFTRPNISNSEALFESMISNDSKPLDPVEEAEAFQRLRSWGLSVAQIAKKLGKSTVHVYRRLVLIDASEELKQEIRDKNITLQDAEQIIKKSSGSINEQNTQVRKVRKSNRMKTADIRKLIIEKKLAADFEDDFQKGWRAGYITALKKVLGE